MRDFTVKQLMKRLFFFFLGELIIGAGVALIVHSNIGSDPFVVFTQGISNVLGVTVGTANMIITSILLIVIFCVSKKEITIGTLLAIFTAGPFIDLMLYVLDFIPFANINFAIKVLFVGLGFLFIAIGFSTLKASDLGVAPNDLVPLIIHNKTKLGYGIIRIIMDVTLVTIGFVLGGVFGLGTVIGVFLTGPLIQFFMPKMESIVKPLIENSSISHVISE